MFDRLKKLEWVSLGKGALIAAAGAALAYTTQWASGQDFGLAAPAVTAGLGLLVNFVRKFATAPQ